MNIFFKVLVSIIMFISSFGLFSGQFNENIKIIEDCIKEMEELKKDPHSDKKEIEKQLKEMRKNLREIKELNGKTISETNKNNNISNIASNTNISSTKKEDKKLSVLNNLDINKDLSDEAILNSKFVMDNTSRLKQFISNIKDNNKNRLNMILYGPRNNGKEFIVKKIASNVGASYISFSGYDLSNRTFSPNHITLTQRIQQYKNSKTKVILHIYEVDTLISGGIQAAFSITEEFIRALKELEKKEYSNLTLIASSDNFETIDVNLLKRDRFNFQLDISLPDLNQRYDFFQKTISKNYSKQEIKEFASLTYGLGLDDLIKINKINSIQASSASLTINSFMKSLQQVKAGNFSQEYSELISDLAGSGVQIIKPEQVNTNFKKLIGMESTLAEVNDIVQYIKNPTIYDELGISPPGGLILHGPPGNGKTELARALAGETNATFITTTGSYFYDTEVKVNNNNPNVAATSKTSTQKIKNIFELARQLSPAIIFIDEFEVIGKDRENTGEHNIAKVNQFLSEMDGMLKNEGKVFVIAATNHLSTIDPALLRPGRFDRHALIKQPSKEERKKFIQGFLKKINLNAPNNLEPVYEMTSGMSVAYLKALVNEAGLSALSKNQNSILIDDFKIAYAKLQNRLSKIKPSSSDNDGDPGFEFLMPEQIKVTFDDIGGHTKAKQDLAQVLTFINNPKKLSKLGAKPVKGAVLYGPPGTGKTMLARSLAGEAKIGFISASGSQFISKYVGGSASRVRHLFNIARENAPCIVFIDEVDALIPDRNSSSVGKEDITTVNQILAELDGINPAKNENIFLLVATNNIKSLDPAVLRPGRLDRHIYIGPPTKKERIEIIKKLSPNYSIAKEVKEDYLVDLTAGWTPAEIKNLFNEAAILSASNGKSEINKKDLSDSKNKIMLGSTNDSTSDLGVKKLVAYHESGHALVSHLLPEAKKEVEKISISARNGSLGITVFAPEESTQSYTYEQLRARVAIFLAGRAAEEISFGKNKITTSASEDLKVATAIVKDMISIYGFSGDSLVYGDYNNSKEIEKILNEEYARVKELLTKNRGLLDNLAKELLEKEELDKIEFKKIVGN